MSVKQDRFIFSMSLTGAGENLVVLTVLAWFWAMDEWKPGS